MLNECEPDAANVQVPDEVSEAATDTPETDGVPTSADSDAAEEAVDPMQAMDVLRRETVEAACVYGRLPSGKRSLRGIVTRERIERYSLSFIYSES